MRATFRNTEKYGVDDAPAYFEEVTVELSVISSAPSASVRKLVTHAERACHAAQSLSHAVPVQLHATLNLKTLP